MAEDKKAPQYYQSKLVQRKRYLLVILVMDLGFNTHGDHG
jgi:hypothetical protein